MTRGTVPLVTLKRGMPSLPFLSLRLAPNVGVNGPNPPPPTRVDERGGPWDSFTMDADSLPLLQSSLPGCCSAEMRLFMANEGFAGWDEPPYAA